VTYLTVFAAIALACPFLLLGWLVGVLGSIPKKRPEWEWDVQLHGISKAAEALKEHTDEGWSVLFMEENIGHARPLGEGVLLVVYNRPKPGQEMGRMRSAIHRFTHIAEGVERLKEEVRDMRKAKQSRPPSESHSAPERQPDERQP